MPNKVNLSIGNWIALIALIYTPVIAAAGWAWAIDVKVTLNSERMVVNSQSLDRITQSVMSLEKIVAINSTRLALIEAQSKTVKREQN